MGGGLIAGARCVADKDFGGRGINVANRGRRRHIKVADAGVYNGGVGDSVEGFVWRRGGTDDRIVRRNTCFYFIITFYNGGSAASRHERVPAIVAGGTRAHRILAGCDVDVAGFLGDATGTGMVDADTPAMGGAEASGNPFVLERRANL